MLGDMNVVFLFNEFSLHNHVITDYLRARPQDRVSVVKVPLVLKGKDRLQTASSILPRLPGGFIAAKLSEFVTILALTFMPKLLSRGAVFKRLRWIASRHDLPFHKTDNIMAPETLSFIRSQDPDVIVTLVHQILRKRLIGIPRKGIVNIHPGLLPHFRGIQPYFWELSEGFGYAGATLHLIEDEEIDTGGILVEARFRTWEKMSVQLNYYLTCCCAAKVLPSCLEILEEDRQRPRKQESDEGNYYRWPDEEAFSRLGSCGHSLTSWKDLWGILSGVYDNFEAEETQFHTA